MCWRRGGGDGKITQMTETPIEMDQVSDIWMCIHG